MPTCPNCGSYVPLGNHSCSCGTTIGSRSRDYDDESRHSGNKDFFDNYTTDEYYALIYNTNISLGRQREYDNLAIEAYIKAVDYGFKYWDLIEKHDYIIPKIPKRNELLAREDVDKCCEIYERTLNKLTAILYYKEIEAIEELLTKTGNEQAYKDVLKKREREREEKEQELNQMINDSKYQDLTFDELYLSKVKKLFRKKDNKNNKSKGNRVRIKID